MMKIKLFVLLSLISLNYSFGQAPENNKKRQEVGVAFGSLNSFGAYYRIGSEKGLWRFSINADSYNRNDEVQVDTLFSQDERNYATFSIRIGREQRISLADKLQFRIGGDLGYNRSNNSAEYINTNDLIREDVSIYNGIEISAVLGMIYQINDQIHMGFEFRPTYILAKSTTETIDYSGNMVRSSERTSTINRFDLNSSLIQLNFGFNF